MKIFTLRITGGDDFDLESKIMSSERMIAIQHEVIRIDFAHRVQDVLRHVGVHALRQRRAVECHALFRAFGEERSGFEEEQLVIEVAESLLGLTEKFQMVHRNSGTAYQRIEVRS